VIPDHAIPAWEQELSAGAVCMTLLIAGEALGYGANWITDWYAVDPNALDVLGVKDGERVAGFIHFGTPAEPPLERPRPDIGPLTRYAGV
jgi:nitroreductase